MKWKDAYQKCNNKKYSRIINISKEVTLHSNFKNFISENSASIIIFLILIISALIYNFRNNIIILLYCLGFFLLLLAYILYYNTYKLVLGKDSLELHMGFQKNIISYSSLANIYLERNKSHILGIPIYTYTLNYVYIENENAIITSLSTIMLSKKELVNFFSNIKTEELKEQK